MRFINGRFVRVDVQTSQHKETEQSPAGVSHRSPAKELFG
jgi:hypothetical protein